MNYQKEGQTQTPFSRLGLFFSQVMFSIITPFLLMPRIAKLRIARSLIAFCFGRAYGNRYQNIIDTFQGRYGSAMAEGLARAKQIAEKDISIVADCGTGTGFVTSQAADYFSDATFIAFDILHGMLIQARENCRDINADILYVQADTFALPLADQSVDLVLVQNTMPCFTEFARVCRPGGIVIYVDSSAGWIANLAKRLVEKHRLFETVAGERVDMGFYVLAQKAGDDKEHGKFRVEGETKQQRLISLLHCPLDRSRVVIEEDHLRCLQRHRFPIRHGIPVMLAEKTRSAH
ncbi:MAG: methyltransferase domain-containing protein [Nitrospirota bacterium]